MKRRYKLKIMTFGGGGYIYTSLDSSCDKLISSESSQGALVGFPPVCL
jgi:hypothetical protein